MGKIVTIHQPNYLPWIGLFSKVKRAECFVVADDFPYTKHSGTNRNKIRTNSGWYYLTIPIEKIYYNTPICNVLLPSDKSWIKNHWENIRSHYAKSMFFKLFSDSFSEFYKNDFQYLWELNMEIILYLIACFKIEVEIIRSSDLGIDNSELNKTETLIEITKAVGGNTYISGPSGRDYLDHKLFRDNEINLSYFCFQHPEYRQRYKPFIPNISAIDLLFNVGSAAGEIVTSSGTLEEIIL